MTETRESAETLVKLQIWLHRYWRLVLALIVLIFIVMGVVGYFQHAKKVRLTEALYTYQTQFEVVNQQNLEQAKIFAATEKNIYTTLTYLEIAKYYVVQGDYQQALAALNQSKEDEKDPFILQVIAFRTARVQFELNELPQSLTTLNTILDPIWQSLVNNLKGDIYVQMKNYPLAKQAYEQALGDRAQTEFNAMIEMKLNQVDAWIEQE